MDIDLKELKPPFLIHSDIFKTFYCIKNEYKFYNRKLSPNNLHFKFLSNLFGKENLIFPSFNYDFPVTKIYDIQKTSSQVGELTNFILNSNLLLRTKTPIFSFLTNIKELSQCDFSPFSTGSVFDYIFENDGSVIFYGTEINSCTYLHFVESQYGPPVYRYDKSFSGILIDNELSSNVKVDFHVRPFGVDLNYDWNYLYHALEERDVVYNLSECIFGVKAMDLSKIWGELFLKSQSDFIDVESRNILWDKTDKFKRRIILSDYEAKKC